MAVADMRKLSGMDAVGILLEEIGEVVGRKRLREMDGKVRAKLPNGGNGQAWIDAIAEVIVDDGDTRADVGFRKGIRRIRETAAGLVDA